MRLSNLVNIGPKLELMLNEVGVESAESLRAMGSVEATFLLCEKNLECVNKLFAVEGAIRGTRWHNINKEDRERLQSDLEQKIAIKS